jgi:hypothetical protein
MAADARIKLKRLQTGLGNNAAPLGGSGVNREIEEAEGVMCHGSFERPP